MKKTTFFFTGLASFGFVLSFLAMCLCSVSAQQKASIRLGVNLDSTGYAAWLGEPQLRAIQLFTEQINTKGGIDGHPPELMIYDIPFRYLSKNCLCLSWF